MNSVLVVLFAFSYLSVRGEMLLRGVRDFEFLTVAFIFNILDVSEEISQGRLNKKLLFSVIKLNVAGLPERLRGKT